MEKWKVKTNATLAKKFIEIKQYRDAQEAQYKADTKGMDTLTRIDNVIQLQYIEGILKGLDIALEILKD